MRTRILLVVAVLLIATLAVPLPRKLVVRGPALFLGALRSDCSVYDALRGAWSMSKHWRLLPRTEAASRILGRDGDYELWATPLGQFWAPANEGHVLAVTITEQQREVYAGVRSGDIVLDCGANVGAFTRTALQRGASKVIAIDPAPEAVECLRRNFGRDNRVVIVPKGVWDRSDVLPMTIRPGSSVKDSLFRDSSPGVTVNVPLVTIDALVQDLRLPRVDYIKMDIEGAEQKALAGARQTIQRFAPRLALSVYHMPDDRSRIPAIVREFQKYRVRCGPCEEVQGRLVPVVMYFF